MSSSHKEIFTKIYETCEWGNNNCEYKGSSGGGSSIEFTTEYTKFIRKFISDHDIHKVVDLGCGDWQSSHLIYENKDVSYYGYDAYKGVITHNQKLYPKYTFTHLDIFNEIESVENGDLCIVKDVLQHWTCDEITKFMDRLILKKYRYIIINNSCAQQYDNQDTPYRSRPLSVKYLPLKQYNFRVLFTYNDKEVSILEL
jgi:hypothetical protein